MPLSIRPVARRTLAALAALALLAACGRNVGRADAYEALSDQLMDLKAYPAAAQNLDRAIKYDSDEPRRWLKLGRAHRAQGNWALAGIAYQRALDLDPANIEALQTLAVLMVRAGHYEESKQFSQPLLVLSPNDYGGLLATGATALFEKNLTEADRIADQLIGQAPNQSDGYIIKAQVLQKRGKQADAVRLLLQRQAISPDDPQLSTELMRSYREAGDLQGIRAQALTLARLQPDDVTWAMESARAQWAAGRRNEAEAVLDRLAKQYKNSPAMLSEIAEFWQGAVPRDQAIARITALAGKGPNRVRAALADELVQFGAAPAAVRLLADVAGQPVGPETVELAASYANALLAGGRTGEARKQIDRVLAFDGNNDRALLVRAREALARRAYDDALVDAQRVVADDPQNEEALILVPQVYAAQDKPLLAARAFGDAQQNLPDSLPVLDARVAWLTANDRVQDAFQLAAQFAQVHQHSIPARRILVATCRKAGAKDCDTPARPERDEDKSAIPS